MKLHCALGPGLLEGICIACLRWELGSGGLPYAREAPLTVVYEDLRLASAYRSGIVVDRSGNLEIKSIERSRRVHDAGRLDYLPLRAAKPVRAGSLHRL